MKTAYQVDPLTSEIGIVNERLYTEEIAPEIITELVYPHKERLLNQIFARKPEMTSVLCFLDVVFLLPQRQTGISRFMVIAPTRGAVDKYNECVKEAVTGGFDFAGHPVFQQGLPRFIDQAGKILAEPQTEDELRDTYRSVMRDTKSISGRFLSAEVEEDASALNDNPDFGRSSTPADFAWQASSFRRYHTTAQYGGPKQPVLENFRRYANLLFGVKEIISDCESRPLRFVTAIPFSYWRRNVGGKLMPIPGGSLQLGTSNQIDDEARRVISDVVSNFVGAALVPAGSRQQQVSFAHQTSSVMDSILDSVERLPGDVRKAIGGKLMGKLYLLGATITSFRSKDARVSPGNFAYPWEENENPLTVYRDIGIELGLARCENAPIDEDEVREEGRAALLKVNRIGEPGFEAYRRLFREMPAVSKELWPFLKQSSFAVLILLTIRQAFYHTIRARILGNSAAAIELRIREKEESLIFECIVMNPRVTENDEVLESKDADELRDLADRLSNIGFAADRRAKLPEETCYYTVEGPFFSHSEDCWTAKTQIRAK